MFVAQIEFKRIQTFLFSSSRLRDMVAANALLAKTIRYCLVTAALKAEGKEGYKLPPKALLLSDDPKALAELVILSRDGGHFYALFSEEKNAEKFIDKARNILVKNLNGVDVKHRIIDESRADTGLEEPFQTMFLPSLQPLAIFKKCEQSNIGVAEVESDRKLDRPLKVSQQTKITNKHYHKLLKNVNSLKADFASIITADWVNQEYELAKDFDELVGQDYLAVISADGNNMGQRFRAYLEDRKGEHQNQFRSKQLLAESFFSSARHSLKNSVEKGLKVTFKMLSSKTVLPFQVLMLGGDDLLIVCQARYAFALVDNINTQLASSEIADGNPLTMSFGVCIASHNLPFYRLHYAAEKLNASAKIKARTVSQNAIQPSCIDWQIVTQAWLDDPISARKQQQIKSIAIDDQAETLLLSQKPYLLGLGNEFSNLLSLAQRFLPASHQSANATLGDPKKTEQEHIISRALIYQLLNTLPQGRRQTELLINKVIARDNQCNERQANVSDNVPRDAAKRTLGSLFTELASADGNTENYAFYPLCEKEHYYATKLGDILELVSLQYLSRAKEVN